MQHHAADQLDVEVALAERALGGLAREREALEQQVVERLARERALAQRVVARAQLLVGVELQLGLEVVDPRDVLLELLELLALAHAQGPVEDRHRAETSNAELGGPDAAARSVARQYLDRVRRAACAAPGPSPAATTRGVARLASRRLRRFSRWRLTWRARSSAARLSEWRHVLRRLARAQGDALEVQRDLGHLGVADRGIALLDQLDLHVRELRDLPRDLGELLVHPLPELVARPVTLRPLTSMRMRPSWLSRVAVAADGSPRARRTAKRHCRAAGQRPASARRRRPRPRRRPPARSAAAQAASVAPVVTTSSTSTAAPGRARRR